MTVSDDRAGPWVEGFDYDQWKGTGRQPPHHEKWDEAFQRAVDVRTEDWGERQQGEFVAQLQVRVSKRNPGWIDGYRVVLG